MSNCIEVWKRKARAWLTARPRPSPPSSSSVCGDDTVSEISRCQHDASWLSVECSDLLSHILFLILRMPFFFVFLCVDASISYPRLLHCNSKITLQLSPRFFSPNWLTSKAILIKVPWQFLKALYRHKMWRELNKIFVRFQNMIICKSQEA
jgi:hypothetical protein